MLSYFQREDLIMQKHRQYWENMIAPLKDTAFNGDEKKYNKYLESSFKKAEPIMEKYSKEGNEFWLKKGDERAFYQTLEPTMLMTCELYEEEMKELLGRDFNYSKELIADSEAERNKKLNKLRKEVLQAYKDKHPEEYKEFILQQKELRERKQRINEEEVELQRTRKIN